MMRSEASSLIIHFEGSLGNLRYRRVFGSRRVSVLFQIHWPIYFWFLNIRLTVLALHFFTTPKQPGTSSLFKLLTIENIDLPLSNSSKIRVTIAASGAHISIL